MYEIAVLTGFNLNLDPQICKILSQCECNKFRLSLTMTIYLKQRKPKIYLKNKKEFS